MAALVVKLVDTQDLKSCSQQCECRFKSGPGHNTKLFRELFLFLPGGLYLIFTGYPTGTPSKGNKLHVDPRFFAAVLLS